MSDDLERMLREELSERAGSAPVSFTDQGLADAAIGGAKRIRRRRRVSAAAGGMSLVVLGAITVAWQPWAGLVQTDDPAPTSTADVQETLAMDILLEDDDIDGYAVLNADGETIPMEFVEGDPIEAYRLSDAYVVQTQTSINVATLDGSSAFSLEPGVDWEDWGTPVRSDGEEFAVTYVTDDNRQSFEIVQNSSGDFTSEVFETAAEISLLDWSDSVAVFSGDLNTATGGVPGSYQFNADHEWGLEAASGAFESVVVLDDYNPGFACVSDLDPEAGTASERETCDSVEDEDFQQTVADFSGDEQAAELVERVNTEWYGEEEGFLEADDIYESGEPEDDPAFDAENWYIAADGSWEIYFDTGDETWTLAEYGEDGDDGVEEAKLSEFTAPVGAVMPVVSYG
ncbi:hypothetical protein [Glycomyces buryatensis]|uniref:Uncharacterized protein n=1 Tax=Glycomyces buryatensis TaxID=2570927 RepID=A0A4V6T6S3_9ACTN|nr:hypothetical protein [Glycomyces buryatensis]THV43206.1 hypothetical protein FAB82_02975 [Glycomyces buryatensis]